MIDDVKTITAPAGPMLRFFHAAIKVENARAALKQSNSKHNKEAFQLALDLLQSTRRQLEISAMESSP